MLEILYRDDELVAVHKPAGLLVHPSELAPDRRTCLQEARDQLGRRVYPVHRLDRQTSGVLVFALTPQAARAYGEAQERGETRKVYHAIVRGWLPSSGKVDKPVSNLDSGKAAEATTVYRQVASVELPFAVGRYASARYSLARLELGRGRTHQIRRHLASISHPILCDTIYGDGRHNRFARAELGVSRMLLHASELEVCGRIIRAPWCEDFSRLFARFGWAL